MVLCVLEWPHMQAGDLGALALGFRSEHSNDIYCSRQKQQGLHGRAAQPDQGMTRDYRAGAAGVHTLPACRTLNLNK